MSVASRQTVSDASEVEKGHALTSPASPLHVIPGFDRLSRKKSYPTGSVLLAEGHTARGVYVLCAGRAKISISSAAGKTLIVRIAGPGDLLGIHATLAGRSYEATAQALAPCRVEFISRQDLLSLLDRERSFGVNLGIAISKEFTEFVEYARVLLLSVSAVEKLAGLLLTWGEAFGQTTHLGIHLQTLLTHEEIGQMIGSSRETVTRALNLLKRRRIIHATNGDLWILNPAALAAVASGGAPNLS